jgi:TonB family protein
MIQGPLLIDTSRKRTQNPLPAPKLLVALEPRSRVFWGNVKDLLWRRSKAPLLLVSRPAAFWPDVFVARPLPWSRFMQSALAHLALIAVMFGWTRFAPQFWPQPTQIVQRNFQKSDVVYYDAAEYLAPLDTGGARSSPKKGEPEHATQPIISVPPEADNRAQTIVTPPNLKLDHDVPLPNIVAWARPQPTIPAAAVADSPSSLNLPVLPTNVIAPAPDVNSTMKQSPALQQAVVAPAPDMNGTISSREVSAPQPSIVEPPREVANSRSRLGDINIGHAQVVAPAPQLPMGEQRAASMALAGKSHTAVVPPPPSLPGAGTARDGRLIALNLHPAAPGRPTEVPAGNRRGTFAATPEGKAGAAGTPDIPAQNRRAEAGGNASGSSSKASSVPSGLYVGASPKSASNSAVAGGTNAQSSDNSPLLANATPPRVTATPPRSTELPANAVSEAERKLFAGRKSYAMTLNVPNLNSAGGSWVMHFAELKDADKAGELVAPVATQEVDPGYPLELMRQQVHGTVILSAVIHTNGAVSDVKILRGVDDRLDQYASAALSRWRFRPATKNGDPVALQTVVMIPFQPMRKPAF